MQYGWQIIGLNPGGLRVACDVPYGESLALTFKQLRESDPMWQAKPHIRPLRRPPFPPFMGGFRLNVLAKWEQSPSHRQMR